MKPKETDHATTPNGPDFEGRDTMSEAARSEAANDATPAPATAEVDPVALLEAEKNDLKEKVLRTLADMENLRRRTEREVADARAYAVTKFARDMLNVADNVRRALENVPEDARQAAE